MKEKLFQKIPEMGFLDKIKEEFSVTLEEVRKAEIFNRDYLDQLKFVFQSKKVSKDEIILYEADGIFKIESGQKFPIDDFIYGKRTDFVGLVDKESYDETNHKDCQELFLAEDAKIPYDEFTVHEIVHNIFDLNYEDKDEDEMVKNILELVKGEGMDLSRFFEADEEAGISQQNIRQKLAEIFALVVELEFAKKQKRESLFSQPVSKMKEFLENPKELIENFNKQTGLSVESKDILMENHIPAFVVATILEKKFPDFKERLKFFGFKNLEKYLK